MGRGAMRPGLRTAWIRVRRKVGWQGAVGVALIAGAVAFAASLTGFERRSREMAIELTNRLRVPDRRVAAASLGESQGEGWREFLAGFPTLDHNADDLGAIFDAAGTRKLELLKGEYQIKVDPNAAFVVYTATFPLRSDYTSLKSFTADVLAALPHAALDDLRLARDNTGNAVLDGTVRFSLYYRSR